MNNIPIDGAGESLSFGNQESSLNGAARYLQLGSFNLTDVRVHVVHFIRTSFADDMILLGLVGSNPACQDSFWCTIFYVLSYLTRLTPSIRVLCLLKPWKVTHVVHVNRRMSVYLVPLTSSVVSDVLFRGASAISDDNRMLAFTNLADGVEIFSIPGLVHVSTIPQETRPSQNVVLGIAFFGDNHIVVGGPGGARIYSITGDHQRWFLQGPKLGKLRPSQQP